MFCKVPLDRISPSVVDMDSKPKDGIATLVSDVYKLCEGSATPINQNAKRIDQDVISPLEGLRSDVFLRTPLPPKELSNRIATCSHTLYSLALRLRLKISSTSARGVSCKLGIEFAFEGSAIVIVGSLARTRQEEALKLTLGCDRKSSGCMDKLWGKDGVGLTKRGVRWKTKRCDLTAIHRDIARSRQGRGPIG